MNNIEGKNKKTFKQLNTSILYSKIHREAMDEVDSKYLDSQTTVI